MKILNIYLAALNILWQQDKLDLYWLTKSVYLVTYNTLQRMLLRAVLSFTVKLKRTDSAVSHSVLYN